MLGMGEDGKGRVSSEYKKHHNSPGLNYLQILLYGTISFLIFKVEIQFTYHEILPLLYVQFSDL